VPALSLLGLPAHPLVVHAAVVLLPLSAVGVVACAAVPRWRRAYAPIVLALSLVSTVAIYWAQSSGEELEERVDRSELVEEHTEKGESVLPWAIAIDVVAIALVASRKYDKLNGRNATIGLTALAVLVAAGGSWQLYEVGHSGAKAVWDEVKEEG
jgi:hypothetical protein